MTEVRFAGYRNMAITLAFLAWASLQTWMFEPPDGKWDPALVNAVAMYLGTTGVAIVGAIIGRGFSKWAERPPEPK